MSPKAKNDMEETIYGKKFFLQKGGDKTPFHITLKTFFIKQVVQPKNIITPFSRV
jgi:hypothetical protein